MTTFLERYAQQIEDRTKEHARMAIWEDYPINAPKRSGPRGGAERGVYEVEFPPAGMRAFNIVTSLPGEVGYVQFPAHWVDRRFVRNLWRRLDAIDPPRPALQVVKHRPASE